MFQIFRSIFLFNNGLSYLRTDIFGLKSEFFSNKIDCFRIQTLVDRNHHTYTHTSSDNLINRYIHHTGQFIGSHEFCQFQYLAFCHLLIFQFLHTVRYQITFLLAIFGSFVLTFTCQTSQSFFYLLCYIFFAHFLLHYRLLKAIFIIVVTVSVLSAATLLISSTVIIGTLTVWSGVRKVRSNVVHIYFFFIVVDAVTFLLTVGIKIFFTGYFSLFIIFFTDFLDDGFLHLFLLILTKFFLFFTLFPFFFFRFFLRTSRLIQCSQVNLSDNINLRYKLSRTNLKYALLFLLYWSSRCFCYRFLFFLLCFFWRYHDFGFFFLDFLNHFLLCFCRLFNHHRFRFFFHRFRFRSNRSRSDFFFFHFVDNRLNLFRHLLFFSSYYRLWFRFFFHRLFFSSPVQFI